MKPTFFCGIGLMRRLVGLMIVVLGLASAGLAAGDDRPDSAELARRQAELDARIADLIEQLGHEEYAVRSKAKSSLQRLGWAAFDALNEAKSHRDPEVSMQAHYLIRSNQLWALDTDPPEVKPILKQYGTQTDAERTTRIGQLAKIDDRKAWPALCRLVRFEPQEPHSRIAALAIMSSPRPEGEKAVEASEMLLLGVGQSKRRSAEWIRTYAKWLLEPEKTLAAWEELVDEEFRLLTSDDAQTTTEIRTTPEIVVPLARWHVESLLEHDRTDQAGRVIGRLAALSDSNRDALLNHVDWLVQRKLWSHVLAAYERTPEEFERHSMLLYRVAEAQRRQGMLDGDATAEKARGLNLTAESHIQAGFALAERGLFDWAETEYRTVIEAEALASLAGARARFLLSEMLHDQEKELEAAQVLEPLVTALDQEGIRELIDRMGRDSSSMTSRMHYFFALDLLKQRMVDEAAKRLRQGVAADPKDADALIALFRLPDQTDEQRRETSRLIREAAAEFQQQIQENSRDLGDSQAQAQNEAIANYFKQQLAIAHNQFAWLVSNTEGDFAAALASSHESLKLRPGTGAYLDTLARCYYAKGDLPSAIKYQNEALQQDPHSGQMRRQLAFFEKEAAREK
jgi:tetratricopeptide (TPR) repeat protein